MPRDIVTELSGDINATIMSLTASFQDALTQYRTQRRQNEQLQQLLREAVAIIDSGLLDEPVDIRDWLKSARNALRPV